MPANLWGKVKALRPDLTSVRRAVGVAAVFFLLGGAVAFYQQAPGFSTPASSSDTSIASPSISAGPGISTTTASTREASPSAGPSRASAPATPTPTTTTTLGAGDGTGSESAKVVAIQVEAPAGSAKPFQTVPIRGMYHGGTDTFVRVQRWERARWRAFPLEAKTDRSGQFTAYVELGEPGLYWLRVLDPGSRVRSKPFLLVIKG
jgi:hypothetical protein